MWLSAEFAKNRTAAVLPLHDAVVKAVRPMIADTPDGQSVFPVADRNTAAMIRHDLNGAGIPFTDDAGRVFDFHALRGQFITDLARAGVPLAAAQKLARHSDPKLTSNLYTRFSVHDQAASVAGLPNIDATPDVPADNAAEARRTGTDDELCPYQCPYESDAERHPAAESGNFPVAANEDDEGRSPYELQGFDAARPALAASGDKAGDGIRTHDGRLGKPALYP